MPFVARRLKTKGESGTDGGTPERRPVAASNVTHAGSAPADTAYTAAGAAAAPIVRKAQAPQVAPENVLDDPRIKALGTNYQMALAATTLANSEEPESEDGTTEAERFSEYMQEQQSAMQEEPGPARKSLASFNLSYKSPFAEEPEQPVRMAVGGTAIAARPLPRSSYKTELNDVRP